MWGLSPPTSPLGGVDDELRDSSLDDFRTLCSEFIFGNVQPQLKVAYETAEASEEGEDSVSAGGAASLGLRCMDPTHPPGCMR